MSNRPGFSHSHEVRGQGFFFLTDGPPLKEEAFGNHAVAAEFIEIMGADFKLVISRRLRRRIRWREIQEASSVPVVLYPDAAIIGLRRISRGLSELVDIAGAAFYTFRVRKFAEQLRPARLFVLAGGNGWFLVPVWLMVRATGLPFDIYLVDDLERSAVLWRQWILRRFISNLERSILRRAARVFCISQGYAEHLQTKYEMAIEWLPPPMATQPPEYRPYVPTDPDIRRIVFVGSGITSLYLSALVECYAAIQEQNAQAKKYRSKLLIISLAGAQPLIERLPNTTDLETLSHLPRLELERICSESWATFLPYSFDEEVRTLVSTSFSWKLSDSFRAGRPILVYGPGYASIPRYFREAMLPLCATSPAELREALQSIEREDTPDLVAQYAEIWRRHHSPQAIRARLRLETPKSKEGSDKSS